jgi:3-hydroxybutyryl-CoA dehydrogenase
VEIRTIALIGAGALGRAIACRSLRAGYRTVLEDFSATTLELAVEGIRRRLGQAGVDTAPSALANFSIFTNVEDAIRDANLIIEAAADEMETKLELFTIFDKFAKPNAIFATTSQRFKVAEISEITSCPERCVGLRFEPVDGPTTATVVPSAITSQETVSACLTACRRMIGSASALSD